MGAAHERMGPHYLRMRQRHEAMEPLHRKMGEIHERMPVVIRDQDRSLWLDHHDEDTEGAIACIERLQDDFEVYPVSKKVNAARYDEPDLIRPI